MKAVPKKKDKKEKKVKIKPKKEHVLIVAQEIKFARLLSGNEKTTRDRALKTLKKWINNCFQKGYEFKESDFARIWKGLFYAVWMSDKPLVQEELCENIAGILDLFPSEQLKHGLVLMKVGFQTMASEWYGIDQHRMDKYLMLVRRYLRGSLRLLLRCGWNLSSCQMYAAALAGKDGILAFKTPHYARNATSMILHVIDCFLEELSKVSEGKIPEDSMAELLKPFCGYICSGETPAVCVAARRLLTELLRQSPLGLSYAEKARAWKQMGCPEGGPDALEPDSDDENDNDDDEQMNGEADDDEDEEIADSTSRPLDPRAGRVDVILSPLPVPVPQLVSMLSTMIRATGSKARKRAKICLQRFQQLSKNEYPLKVTEADIEPPLPRGTSTKAAKALQSLEKSIGDEADELALRGLSRKHRKRLLAKSRAGQSIVEDVQKINSSNGAWQVDTEESKNENGDNTNNIDNHKNLKNRKRKSDKKQDGGQNGDVKRKKIEKDSKKEPRLILKDPLKKLDKLKKSIKAAERIKKGLLKKDEVVNSIGGVSKVNKLGKKDKNSLGGISKKKNKSHLLKSEKVEKKANFSEKSEKNSDISEKTKKSTTSNKEHVKTTVKPKILDKEKPKNLPKILDKKPESPKKTTKNPDSPKKPDKITDTLYKPAKIETRLTDVRARNLKTLNANKNAKKNFQKQLSPRTGTETNNTLSKTHNTLSKTNNTLSKTNNTHTPKKVKFVLKNNSIQGPVDYYKSVKQSPNIPFDSSKMPSKTNLKPSSIPSPINPFFKKKFKIK